MSLVGMKNGLETRYYKYTNLEINNRNSIIFYDTDDNFSILLV